MPAKQIEPALIAGGGIGGLAAALALARIGWPSVVAERRAEWSEAGAGIQLSPNGVRVLEQLGIARPLEPLAGRPREIVVRDAASARVLQRLPLGDWIARRHGAPYWQLHRRDLQAALVAAVDAEPLISIHRGFEVTSFEDDGRQVRLTASNDQTLRGSLLIGADGVFSTIRRQLSPQCTPSFSGRTAARTVVPAERFVAGRHVIDIDATGVWLAPGAHIVHYPIRAGREVAIVVVRTEEWCARGWSEPATAVEIEGILTNLAPAFASALGTGHDWRRWALFEAEPLDRWSKGHVTLLGDAAHPTLPFLAQGGVLALEDAVTLAGCLSRAAGRDAIPSTLLAYRSARAERCRRVMAAARRNGTVFHLSGPAAVARNIAMRFLSGERVMAGYDWVYGWQPEPEEMFPKPGM
jgi:salicylate hydroxylase